MTGKQLSRFTASTAALTVAVLWSGAAMAQTALRVADSFPTGHYIAENQTKPWMEKMKELTGGKVSFQHSNNGPCAQSNVFSDGSKNAGTCGGYTMGFDSGTYVPSPSGTCPASGGALTGMVTTSGASTVCCH